MCSSRSGRLRPSLLHVARQDRREGRSFRSARTIALCRLIQQSRSLRVIAPLVSSIYGEHGCAFAGVKYARSAFILFRMRTNLEEFPRRVLIARVIGTRAVKLGAEESRASHREIVGETAPRTETAIAIWNLSRTVVESRSRYLVAVCRPILAQILARFRARRTRRTLYAPAWRDR